MAQRAVVETWCDIDETPGAEHVTFGLDGVDYQIDLSPERAAELRDELERYVSNARRAGGRKVRGTVTAGKAPYQRNPESAKIREWAGKNGYTVAPIGRISAEVQEAYEAAQRQPAPVAKAQPARRRAPRKAAVK